MERGRKKFLGRHLMVKGKYVDLILSGKKTATIRKGRWVPKFKELILHGGGRPFAVAEVVDVEYKKLSEITQEEIKEDGFDSKAELVEELRRAYGEISDDDIVTIIRFKVKKKLTELDVKDPYMGLEPVEIARLALRYLELNEEDKRILETLVRAGSLREAAIRLYGDIGARWRIRKAVKRALKELVDRKLIGPR
ncbi:MAG: ASCH domain-containing protein [Crenarchaeota archaeon]|nr:ASCH domain-containing protein [Thermoproteota archaeon]